jgi:hypothetical protein
MSMRMWRLTGLAAAVAAMLALAAPAGATTVPLPTLPSLTSLTPPVPDTSGTTGSPDVGASDLRAAIQRAIAAGAKPRKLRKESPGWYTRSERRKVKRDPDGVTTAPADAPLPGEVGIRPGAWMIAPFFCTMNYIFQKGGTLAIGTAGHCLEGNEPVVLLTLAPGGENPVLVELGRVLLKRDGGIGRDYGLVEIPRHLHSWTFETVGLVGGPCGVYAGGDPQPVAHYGHGLIVGTGGTPRAGMGFELEEDPKLVRGADWDWDQDSIVWAGVNNGGDSGSPVRIGQLPAVSNLTHGISVTGLDPGAISWGTRVTTITGSGWTLRNSRLCPP